MEELDFKGYDPYDGLASPLFRLPILRKWKLLRFLSQQFIKRFPINIRPILGVPLGENPVTLGLSIQAYAYLLASTSLEKDLCQRRIDSLLERLEKRIPQGFHGSCWGYDFDWEARRANIPAYQPTVVATGIIVNALYESYLITKNKRLAELVQSAADFVLHDLNKSFDEKGNIIFSYSPFDGQKVFNASMKGARVLVQAYSIEKKEEYFIAARKAVDYVISKQAEDGSWAYSEASEGGWVDNYHTGYVLDCLSEFSRIAQESEYEESLKKGVEYYKDTFVGENGRPAFYSHNPFPIDCTAGSQQILSLSRFNFISEAEDTAKFMISEMQLPTGGFAFRQFPRYRISTEFMRWSNAWMFAALSYLLYKKSQL